METLTFPELTKVVLQKVQELEPENAIKIVGYLLLDDHAEQEITQLAFGPDDMIKSFIDKTKQALKLSPKTTSSNHDSPPKDKKLIVSSKLPTKFTPFVPSSSRFPVSPAPPRADNAISDAYIPMYQPLTNYNFECRPFSYMEPSSFHYQPQFLPLEDQYYNMAYSYFQPNQELAWQPRPHQRSPSIPGMRLCERFREGYCKFGGECKFLHVVHVTDDYSMALSPPLSNDGVEKDCNVFTHGFIKNLEKELVEILKFQGADPLPIACLPALYHERYRKKLQSVCGMEDMLLYMTDTICTIERPNGELCAILAEEFPKYMKSIDDKYEWGQSFSTSCQVYLTFPSQSSFTQEDVYQYFNTFGPVKSVQIPVKLKRMYGLVTFVYPESVTAVLTKGNPHFVCGMRVLVKPYLNKQECIDRKSEENRGRSIWSPTYTESRRLSSPGASDNIILPMKQQNEEHDPSVDLKRKNIWEMESSGSSSHNSFSIHALPGPSTSGGICIDCFSKGKSISTMTCDYEAERFEELNLPDSPFAFEFSHGDSSINGSEWEKDPEL